MLHFAKFNENQFLFCEIRISILRSSACETLKNRIHSFVETNRRKHNGGNEHVTNLSFMIILPDHFL